MTFRIRRAHVRDLTKVKPLWKAMMARYDDISDGAWQIREPAEAWARRHQEYLEWINDATGVVFLAVDDDDEVIGYAALRFVTSGAAFDLGENYGDLESLAVQPENRGQGVGAALMAACRKELDRREIHFWVLETLTSNRAALRLYEREGFSPFMVKMVQHLGGPSD